jgi:predicted O-methyltransferase YrrM
MFWKKQTIKDLLPFPEKAFHAEYSMIFSAHDESRPSAKLLEISLNAIQAAGKIRLDSLCKRLKTPPYYPNLWPGEHYRLLAGFVQTLSPKLVIEIGTATGLSALSMKPFLPSDGAIVTFDLIGWEKYEGAYLKKEDFSDKTLVQFTDDLSQPYGLEKHRELLEKSELIFIDATHDGDFEESLLKNFRALHFKKAPLILLDDIRVWSMLRMWRNVELPKLDLTSFGHWSGTGVIEWPEKTDLYKKLEFGF